MPRWRNGIRDGLKHRCSQGLEGSSPSRGTKRAAPRSCFFDQSMSIKSWFQSQRNHFNILSGTERRFLVSYFLYGLASPIAFTYMNTFLWRIEENVTLLILYNAGFFAALSIGFFLNAILLRWTDTPVLYVVGSVMVGVVPLAMVALGEAAADFAFLLGVVLGVSGGFYWANRNYLLSKVTSGSHRFYFLSLEGIVDTVAGIIAPISIGWIIGFGDLYGLYSTGAAYWFVSVIAILTLGAAGLVVYRADLPPCSTPLKQIFLQNPAALWQRQRFLEVCHGFIGGVETILPVVITLTFLGAEEVVGTIETATAIVGVVLLGLIGRHVKHRNHLLILVVWMLGTLVGGGIFAVLFSSVGAIIYFAISALTNTFRWPSLAAVMYELVDQFSAQGAQHRFVYLMDREFFLNIGRLGGLLLVWSLAVSSPVVGIRFGLLFLVVGQIGLLFIIKPILHSIVHRTPPIDITPDEPAP